MILTKSTIVIELPRSEVYKFLVDPAMSLKWRSGVEKFETEFGMPLGSKGDIVLNLMGRKVVSHFEIMENDGIGRIRARTYQGPLTFDALHELEELTTTSTQLTIRTNIDGGLVFKLAEPAIESVASARLEYDMAALKAVIENQF